MKSTLCLAFLFLTANIVGAETTAMSPSFDIKAAQRFEGKQGWIEAGLPVEKAA